MTAKASTTALAFLATLVVLALPMRVHGQIFTDAQAELRLQWLQMKRELPRDPRPQVQRFAECISKAILNVVPKEYQDLDWEVIVFDSDSRNAQVMPEGKIAIYSGLLEVANTPDEMAAVLGHEVAHLTEGHVHQRVLRSAGTGLLGVAGGVLTGFGRESQTTAEVLFQLPYQREQEREADLVGMHYMAMAGYNPAATLELWRGMSENRDGAPPEWLSTHPDPDFRMSDMAKNLAPALVEYNKALDSGVRPRCRL